MYEWLLFYCDVFVVRPLDSVPIIREMLKFTFSSTVKAVKLYIGADKVRNRMPIILEWDRGNRHDRNAISVFVRSHTGRKMTGHLTKEDAAKARPLSTLGEAPCIRVGTVKCMDSPKLHVPSTYSVRQPTVSSRQTPTRPAAAATGIVSPTLKSLLKARKT